MKPKTKLQKLVVQIKLPKINAQQKKEAISTLFKHQAIRTRTKGTTCLECGHTFDLRQDNSLLIHSIQTECKCLKCSLKLEILDTRKRGFEDSNLYSIHSIYEGMQVLRYFEITQKYVYGKPAEYNFYEVCRCFITTKGKWALMGKLNANSWYSRCYYSHSGDFEIRDNLLKYNISCDTWSGSKLIPEIYRNGFDGDLHKHSEIGLFITLLSNNKMETLFKMGQYELFERFYDNQKGLLTIWPALKACFKNNYKIENHYLWYDYIQSLIYFHKDISNAHYACPQDLRKEHDIYMNRKKRIMAKVAFKERMKQLKLEEEEFIKLKGKFIGLEFSNDIIKVKALESVKEHEIEGDVLNHCVYSSGDRYYLKPNTLILSARINDEPIETIEVSLQNYSILQCHGKGNMDSKYHKEIIKLVNSNKSLIKNYGTKSRSSHARQLA